ncbi:hypothetical protein GCM10010387_36480 [Streptomyces inusitatus]|uniref:RHS repeat-associated core domain-containing protein n=1 Tax=Streptomyces inusitatus TaxID=68221 RepID=A0A918UWX1_9ACTN|nr:hypothetical protein GCM10010387_36480 [Streptomyces inusitatus]
MAITILFTGKDPAQAVAGDVELALTLDQADSWFADGANEPVSADEVLEAGGRPLAAVAADHGVEARDLAAQIARGLPAAIDRLTPAGRREDASERLQYGAYGSGGPAGSPAPDSSTGWYLLGNGYRAYSPTLSRFHSPDAASPFGAGGLNAYAYCSGDPVNYVDPAGH